jgi:hypothetical protein
MKSWQLLIGLSVSLMIGALASAEAATSQCDGYGGCRQVEISPPRPAAAKPVIGQPIPNSSPARPSEKPIYRHIERSPKHPQKRIARKKHDDRERYLHHPSTAQERAETRALNRQSFHLSDRDNDALANRRDRNYSHDQQQYQLSLRNYHAALQDFDWSMRAYSEWFNRLHIREHSNPQGEKDSAHRTLGTHNSQERLDPWHGYNSGPNNGY